MVRWPAAASTTPSKLLRKPSLAAVAALLLLAAGAAPRAARAQETNCDPGDVEVRGLHFTGNRHFSDAELGNAVVTTPSSFVRRVFRVLGERRCIDRSSELPRDLLRVLIFYRNHGYAQATVDTVVRGGRKGIDVTFRVSEGRPVVIDSLAVVGLDSVPERRAIEHNLAVRRGQPFDKGAIEAARDTLERRLKSSGYPDPIVLRQASSDTAAHTATVEYEVIPGPRAHIGHIAISIEPRAGARREISEDAVRNVLGVKPGDLYRYGELTTAQRNLYQTDAYEHVDIRLLADSAHAAAIAAGTDSTVDISVSLLEQRLRSAAFGGGLGTLDCFRLTGEYTDRNIGHQANRLDVSAQVSKIGIGRPLNALPSFCRSLVNLSDSRAIGTDPYSDTLNYRVAATFQPRALFGIRTLPSLTLFSEVHSEYKAYLRRTPFGAATAVGISPFASLPATLAYQYTFGRTSAAPAFFCAVFSRCDKQSRDQVAGGNNRGLGTLSLSAQRARTNAASDPSGTVTRGVVISGELRHASKFTGSSNTFEFTKGTGDAAWYLPVIGGGVLATRLRAGAVIGGSLTGVDSRTPTEERLYAGGPTTVRGYGQNELGPVVYTINTRDTVYAGSDSVYLVPIDSGIRPDRVIPVGGNTLLVANLEYRSRRFADNLLQYVIFTDAGQVWNRGKNQLNLDFNSFKVTPGVGVRVYTTLGFTFRVDVGYNAFAREAGALYYTDPIGSGGEGGQVYCLSPGERITKAAAQRAAEAGTCSAYAPQSNRSFFSRLTPSFSIGQAF